MKEALLCALAIMATLPGMAGNKGRYLNALNDCYAAPARQTDYSNLPPAYTFVCTAEPFYCETLSFVENLRKAGVETGCDVYEGLYHAFDMLSPGKEILKAAISRFEDVFRYAQQHYFKNQ